MEFHLFVPQMRMTAPQLVERAQAAETAGFDGIAGMDHLTPIGAACQPMFEAMTTSTWLAAHTSSITVSSLVLCDAFRHPAVLAQQAVSLDHMSGGRFELGIGWGSVVEEFRTFGVQPTDGGGRRRRLKETLEVLQGLWSGQTFDYCGTYFNLQGARQAPVPLRRIPILIGGAGPKTMALVAAHADWWNVHIGALDRLDEMRGAAGRARVSIQQMVGYVPAEQYRAEITAVAQRRFGTDGLIVGRAEELVDRFGGLGERGVERVYVGLSDFARPETLSAFAETVIAVLR
jgi:alkanesulfonate monooxygenase SsuD/methylene tetrahydromethanopterin reductase-like flavin-dependent oxidoreductase (luciferase family)